MNIYDSLFNGTKYQSKETQEDLEQMEKVMREKLAKMTEEDKTDLFNRTFNS